MTRATPPAHEAQLSMKGHIKTNVFSRSDLFWCLQGIFISRVSEEGPAARAGVKVGDKLLEVKC